MGELHGPEVFGVHRTALDGSGDLDIVPLAFGDRLCAGVSAVSEHFELISFQHLHGRQPHWMKRLAVVRFVGNVVMYEAAVDIAAIVR
jgi:hypothetical protein